MRIRSGIAGLCMAACCFTGRAQAHPECHAPQSLETDVRSLPTARSWAALGGWFGEQGQFACAIPAFQAALHIDPNSASLHYYYGLTLHSAGQSNAAIAEINRSIELDPNQLKPRLLSGVILNQIGQTTKAEEAWEAALRVDPSSAIALDWLSKARIRDGEFEAAIDLLKTAPIDEELSLDLAVAYSGAGEFDKAAETLNTALARSPGELRLSAALATVCVQAHRYQDGIASLRTALNAHPDDAATELLYLRLLVLQSDDATARPLASRMLAAHPANFDALYLSGILENDAQEFDVARKHLQAAVNLNPNHYDARYNLGIALFHLQQPQLAHEQLEKAVSLDSSQAEAHFQLAQVLRSLGQSAEAQAHLKVFQARQQATINLAMGQTKAGQAAQALKSGDAAHAAVFYREAIEAQPQDAVLEYDLALALERSGDQLQERAALERAIAINPKFAAAENQLGFLAEAAGDTVAAERHFRNALAASPRFAEAANNLGALSGKNGRDKEAEVLFLSAVSANPRYTRGWVNLAATLASESRFPEAREAIESALRIDPQDSDALRLRQMLAAMPVGPSTSQGSAVPPGESSNQGPQ
jgi:tetratricopeptide (TPR) repeat protein